MEKTSKNRPHKARAVGKKEINLALMAKAVLKKLWLVILITVIAGAGAYTAAKLLIQPTYRSTFTAYVNNKKETDLSTVSNQDIQASKSLAHTFEEVIRSKTVLANSAKAAELKYSYSKLRQMVTTSISNETEIITVNVDAESPDIAYKLAEEVRKNALAYTAVIIEGSSMKIIDNPEKPGGIYGPNYIRYGLVGALAGLVVVVLIICVKQFFNDRIQNEAEFSEHYTLPVIGVIPDLVNADKNKGNYYYYSYYGYSAPPEENGDAAQGKGEQK